MNNKSNIKEIKNICWKRKYDFFFFFYITTFIPIVSFIDKDIDSIEYLKNIFFSFGIGVQLFIISLLFKERKRIIFLLISLFFTLVPSIIVLSYLAMNKVFIDKNNFFIIYETNTREALEFLQNYVNLKVIITLIIYFCFPITCIYATRNERFYIKNVKIGTINIHYSFIVIFFILFIFFPIAFTNPYRFNHIPFTSFYKNYYRHKVFLAEFSKYDAYRENMNLEIKSNFPDSIQNKTFVIIIGESLTRKHMSLYNYIRKTTPLLDNQKDDLLVFQNVISPHTNTIDCLKTVLTFSTNENDSAYFNQPSIIELFNSVGYTTYWLDAQGIVGEYESVYGVLIKRAKQIIDLTQKNNHLIFDELTLAYLSKILNKKEDKVVFIHLMGNHVDYKNRYPSSFESFGSSMPFCLEKISLNDKQKQIINEYDNSVLYNDFIVSSIIDSTKKYAPFSYALYFSDHAQELFDIKDRYGHSFSNYSKYACEIPFILWRSEEYKKHVQLSEENINKPYTTEDAIYSISQLSGLEYDGYDSSKSIFSDDFKEKRRTVGKYYYEELED